MLAATEEEKREDIRNILIIITSKMVLPLYFSFWLLDIIYVPNYKWDFLVIRSAVIPVAIITSHFVSKSNSFSALQNIALCYVFFLAAILHLMIFIVGPNALYYNCLHLVSIGSLSFIPFSKKYFLLAAFAIYAPYYAIEFNHIENSAQYVELAVNTFIVFSIISITWIIKLYHLNFREKDRSLRQKLELEIEKTKNAEKALVIARDEAIEATKAKSCFLANMSHEIRTPLTAIIGFSKLLKHQKLSKEKSRKNVNTVIKNSEHLLHIINDILDFSKIEANQLTVENTKISLFKFISDTNNLVEGNIVNKGLEYKINYHFPIPSFITSDEVRLKQIIINLCGNAGKFTANGYVHLDIKYEEASNQLFFSVLDSGIGLTETQIDKIFDSFTQADLSTTKNYGGTGLGLSISKQLSQKLGGDISVTSEVDSGSCFTFSINPGDPSTLEMVNALPEVDEEKEITQILSTFDIQVSGHILLVEDTIDNQELISFYLNDMGAQVSVANNGKECIELVQNKTFDMILMDMQMPVMGGYDALRALREQNCQIPIVMLTGNVFEEERQRCLEAGSNGFLSKPIDLEALTVIVERYLDNATSDTPVAQAIESEVIQEIDQQNEGPIISKLMGKSDKIDRLIMKFSDHLNVFVNKIEQAYIDNDFDILRSEAHKLKGVGGNYGFLDLTDICRNLEIYIESKELDCIKECVERLKSVEKRITLGIDEYKSTL